MKPGCAAQVMALVAGSAGFIRSVHGWKTVCALIAVTSLHPEAAAVSMKALAAVARPPALSPVAFTPVLEAVVSCVERNAKVIAPKTLPQSQGKQQGGMASRTLQGHAQSHKAQCTSAFAKRLGTRIGATNATSHFSWHSLFMRMLKGSSLATSGFGFV